MGAGVWGDELGMRGGLGVGVYCSGETERDACVVGGLPCARERGWRWHMFCVVCDCGVWCVLVRGVV